VGALDSTCRPHIEKTRVKDKVCIRADELLGCKVVSVSGQHIGRVHDLRAEQVGDQLCVTALMVGSRSWMVKVGISRGLGHEIPWDDVLEIDTVIRIRGEGRKVGS
jgi:sporulation protein YlmC with PRC-barrel domain